MDEHAKIPRALVDKLFELGVMGIEIPEAHGGAGGSFFHAVLAVEELSRVDPSIGVLVDVQNTLVINALAALGQRGDQAALSAARWPSDTVGAYALSEAGSGSDAFALDHARHGGRRRLRAERPQALDHQRATKPTSSSSSPPSTPRPATAASPRSWSSAASPDFTVGKKEDKLGIRASSTCELLFDDCRVPQSQRARRGRQGLQGRPSRRSTKDGSASAPR